MRAEFIKRLFVAIQEKKCIFSAEQDDDGNILRLAYSIDRISFSILNRWNNDIDSLYSFLVLHAAERVNWSQIDRLLLPSNPEIAVYWNEQPKIRRKNHSYLVWGEYLFSKDSLANINKKDGAIMVEVDRSQAYLIIYDKDNNIVGISCGMNRRIRL